MTQSRPPVETLRSLFRYEPDTGFLYRGSDRAGYLSGQKRYRSVSVSNAHLSEHIVIWAVVTGCYPEGTIDHINRDGTDNRWANLRLVSASHQQANRGLFKNNKSGRRGVYWYKGKWVAAVRHGGKTYHLGRFDDIDAASEAVEQRRVQVWGAVAS